MSTFASNHKTLKLPDNRQLGYAEYGNPAGKPLIVFHGMPGSRYGAQIFEAVAAQTGTRLIAPERPGYGLSAPLRERPTMYRVVDDVITLADALKLSQFALMGVSGGGPYALACASKFPQRVLVAGLVSGIGPLWLPNSMQGMVTPNKIMFTLGRWAPALAGFLLPRLVKSSLPSMEQHVQNHTSPVPELSPETFAILVADQKGAFESGGAGTKLDMQLLTHPWNFPLEKIRVPVRMWHGDADNLAPAALARYLAQHLPDCKAVFIPAAGHTGTFPYADEIVKTLLGAYPA